ncbi:nucleoside 2-deoxyribosyltransferase [Rhizobium sp. PAMB 3182]
MDADRPLLIGEIFVDFSLGTNGCPVKLRLGGIVHAARGLWSAGIAYSVAAICPSYLVAEAESYLKSHGCIEFIHLACVTGAPNVFVIGDVREVGHQGYEDLLRDERVAQINHLQAPFDGYQNVIVYPGALDLKEIATRISDQCRVTIDIAYDVNSVADLAVFGEKIANVAISTSSDLFAAEATSDIERLLERCRDLGVRHLLLKENRGGSRLFSLEAGQVDELPAVLGDTVNSVGVGDVYTAVFAAYHREDTRAAAWRGMQVATQYAQTTFPDDLRTEVGRQLRLTVDEVKALGGVSLPWHERPRFEIYLAAPDFSYIHKPEIDAAVSALQYHNFRVRRPIAENGEAKPGSEPRDLMSFYESDVELLNNCSAVFAVPLERDPGTLVEVGMAISAGKPVITYDPRKENNNTMVVCGSSFYSSDLGECINGAFELVSKLRKKTQCDA